MSSAARDILSDGVDSLSGGRGWGTWERTRLPHPRARRIIGMERSDPPSLEETFAQP